LQVSSAAEFKNTAKLTNFTRFKFKGFKGHLISKFLWYNQQHCKLANKIQCFQEFNENVQTPAETNCHHSGIPTFQHPADACSAVRINAPLAQLPKQT